MISNESIEGPTAADIEMIFKRLRAVPANKVFSKIF
jgi:hypothetical protein